MIAGRESRLHIGIYGRCNAGKSSLLNYITATDAAIVSPEGGTTTDPVRRSYEITGFAPVVLIDTAGVDDRSPLGGLRRERTDETLSQIDLAIIVFREWSAEEERLEALLAGRGIPCVKIRNGAGSDSDEGGPLPHPEKGPPPRSANGFPPREKIIDDIKRALPEGALKTPRMFGDEVSAGDVVLLVCPIDSGAPAGRLILPQVQALRELLDRHAVAITVQPEELAATLKNLQPPKMVVTDSQVFAAVRRIVPESIPLTSFSILLAAAKGDMETYNAGLARVDALKDGDRVLIVENCLHQSTCEDIGRVKIPRWLGKYSGKRLNFTFLSGLSPLPEDIASYALMVQCGGCMVTRSQLLNRIRHARSTGVAVTNYGMLIRKIT